jgi:HAD superfamily hydrolase (TIGR01490 family)
VRLTRRRARTPAGTGTGVDYVVADLEPVPPSESTPDTTAAGFFDLDNTMLQGAAIYYLARGLASRRYFTTRDLLRFGLQQLRFRVTATEHDGHMAQARELALAFVAGRRVDELRALAEEIFDELMAERIWAGTHALARMHLEAGQRVWLVTAAPVELGAMIATRLGLTGAIGTVAEVRDGVYTGRLVDGLMHGPAKAAAIADLAEREGLDLARCAAYSDSINDLPMLSAVGRPVAVNPDAALRRVAAEQGWEIRDFRTGRRAVKIAAPAALGAGMVAGAVAAAVAVSRRSAVTRTGRGDARGARRESVESSPAPGRRR